MLIKVGGVVVGCVELILIDLKEFVLVVNMVIDVNYLCKFLDIIFIFILILGILGE